MVMYVCRKRVTALVFSYFSLTADRICITKVVFPKKHKRFLKENQVGVKRMSINFFVDIQTVTMSKPDIFRKPPGPGVHATNIRIQQRSSLVSAAQPSPAGNHRNSWAVELVRVRLLGVESGAAIILQQRMHSLLAAKEFQASSARQPNAPRRLRNMGGYALQIALDSNFTNRC